MREMSVTRLHPKVRNTSSMKKFEYETAIYDWMYDKQILLSWGEKGWELCTAIPVSGGRFQFIFKRQIVT